MAGPNGTPRTDVTWTARKISELDLSSQRAVIVGGTGGLGRAIAQALASRGAEVTVVGQTFRDAGTKGLTFVKADLSLMAEATRIGRELPAETLDLVILTTGIFAGPKREETPEGIERDLAVSYLNRLALVRELAPRLGRSRAAGAPMPRVFVMGFPGTGELGNADDLNAERDYKSMPVHMNTVAGNEALVLDSARRYPEVAFFGLNPGLIKTNIRANVLGGEGSFKQRLVEGIIGLVMISPETYAARIVPVLVAPGLEAKAPVMFNQRARAILASPAMTDDKVAALITSSEKLLERALTGR